MREKPQVRMLPDGKRLHLQDGPIDLIIQVFGAHDAISVAYRAAARRFDGLLDELCIDLAALRQPAAERHSLTGPVAGAMHGAVRPFAAETFITPMAAVAGAVADAILAAMTAASRLDQAFVNNGGDIALHCAPGQHFRVGMVDRPDRPSLYGHLEVGDGDGIRGIATSGWRGRSFSLGIADCVTVLARTAAEADAAATVIANAVDLPGHPAVQRVPADSVKWDSDLGDRLVTRGVNRLHPADRRSALYSGARRAEALLDRELILGATLHLQGETMVVGVPTVDEVRELPAPRIRGSLKEAAHA